MNFLKATIFTHISDRFNGWASILKAAGLILAVSSFTGCTTTAQFDELSKGVSGATTNGVPDHIEMIQLREGDVVKIAFPGSPTLDTTQQIRRDGKISMSLVGDVQAAGKTPDQLKEDLLKLYANQISSKEATVELQSSSFPVFVTGCVMHSGKVLSDKPITALEAVMESGGFDFARADLRSVRIIRLENGASKTYHVNLKAVLDGEKSQPFYLQPSDIVYVPERFSWF